MLDICFGDSECGMLKHALRKSKDGVSFTFRGLEIGKIAPNDFYLGRREWIDRFFAVCSAKERSQILAEDIKRFEAIIQAAKRDEVLRIWIASSPCSKSGYYHLIHSLQGINCPILVVELPADFSNYRSGDNTYDHSWGEVDVSLLVDARLTVHSFFADINASILSAIKQSLIPWRLLFSIAAISVII